MNAPLFLLFGNSGTGKSTLAKQLVSERGLSHLDLDTIAWAPEVPPVRRALQESAVAIENFLVPLRPAVVEGCYADLLSLVLPRCTQMIFLNPGLERCIANTKSRPWEPHKYASVEAQNANLPMLLQWVSDYATRTDTFSLAAHRALFDAFNGQKIELTDFEMIRQALKYV